MQTKRFKNGIGLCANQGCMHLMSTAFEFYKTDPKGHKKRVKFVLCDDCTDELLKELNDNVKVNCES